MNIVSAMVDSVPAAFRHVVPEAGPPNRWYSTAYSHLNLRIDQLKLDDWDFRIFHHDEAWGWDWPTNFAYDLGDTIRRMAQSPLKPLLEEEKLKSRPAQETIEGPPAKIRRQVE